MRSCARSTRTDLENIKPLINVIIFIAHDWQVSHRRKLQRQFKDFIAIFGIICFHFCQIRNLLFGMKKTDKFQTNFFFLPRKSHFFPLEFVLPSPPTFPYTPISNLVALYPLTSTPRTQESTSVASVFISCLQLRSSIPENPSQFLMKAPAHNSCFLHVLSKDLSAITLILWLSPILYVLLILLFKCLHIWEITFR